MKAVIIAAGKSTRTYPLTIHKPKPLLEVMGRPVINFVLQGLAEYIDEWIIVVGFKDTEVKNYVTQEFPDHKVSFVKQEETNGTGAAIAALAEELRGDQFVVINGDDLYHPRDLIALIQSEEPYAVMAKEVDTPERFGILKTEGEYLLELVEKPQTFIGNLANIGVYKFDGDIFDHTLQLSPRGEYEVVDYINYLLLQGKDVQVLPVEHYWLPLTYPWDVLRAQEHFLREADLPYVIHPTAKVDGSAFIGSNVYIGAGVKVGPEVELSHCCLYEDSEVEGYVRMDGSILSEGTVVKEGAIVDGNDAGDILLPLAGKDEVAVVPEYKGVFTERDSTVEGFITAPRFIVKE